MHIKTAAAFDPVAVDQSICLEQAGVIEQRKGRCLIETFGFHVHEGVSKFDAASIPAGPEPAMTLG